LLTNDNLTLIIKPQEKLENLTRYTIIINASASDFAGNNLGKDFVLSFKTGTGEEDDSTTLFILFIIVIVIIIVILILYLRGRGKEEEKIQAEPEPEEEDFPDEEGPKNMEEKEELLEEGLGEDDKELEEDLEDEKE
jgi:hypothetical protein